MIIRFAIPLTLALVSSAFGQEPATYRYFLLMKVGDELVIEPREVRTSGVEVAVLAADETTGIIDVILPVGPGGSGNMASLSDGRTLTIVCGQGKIKVTDGAHGEGWTRPDRTIEDLALRDVRVSVTGGDGLSRAFLIERNERVVVDEVGPVVDLFAGKVPLGPRDYSVFTDTERQKSGGTVEGSAELTVDRWPFVRASVGGSEPAWFLVDIGAGTTVVSRSFLPEGTEVREAGMVQYSGAGREVLKYAPEGATGKVQTVAGHADLPLLQIGDLRFPGVTVDVMEEIPDFFRRPIAGILGMDLMGRAPFIALTLAGEEPRLELSSKPWADSCGALELPFSVVRTHFMVRGKIRDASIAFILDSGAPTSFLDGQAAEAAGLTVDPDSATEGGGLDGGKVPILDGGSATLELGGASYDAVPFRVSDLGAFATLRGNGQLAGLLGNDFFARFRRVILDRDGRVARFVP